MTKEEFEEWTQQAIVERDIDYNSVVFYRVCVGSFIGIGASKRQAMDVLYRKVKDIEKLDKK